MGQLELISVVGIHIVILIMNIYYWNRSMNYAVVTKDKEKMNSLRLYILFFMVIQVGVFMINKMLGTNVFDIIEYSIMSNCLLLAYLNIASMESTHTFVKVTRILFLVGWLFIAVMYYLSNIVHVFFNWLKVFLFEGMF
ncbi:hypothetical protein COF68_06260 [Bacillus toyonensis]|uniref:hypothetical protein n=1 Tax=Bacillus toyonensis TaxID=155322 RepID=UPI000BFD2D24|nr:hypothetical protein [Bacillus toyonensis]PHE64437.1 hypothetical protein COF68_06260 [Bacillus toyonensis]